jgi:hypothetical protein
MSDQISTLDDTQTEALATPAPSKRARKSSAAAKLLQAAALAAMLVPLGSVAAEASTCTFGGSGSCSFGPEGGQLFDFGVGGTAPYKVELRFDQTFGEFDVTITDDENTYAEITNRFTEFFGGYQPVPIGSNPLAPFIVFGVDAPAPCTTDAECNAPGTNTWRSDNNPSTRGPGVFPGYELWIYWTAETDGMFPHPETLHDTGSTGPESQFDIKITIPGSYNPGPICDVFLGECVDPAVGGRDDMFQDFTLADGSSVPEPTSLLLLGSGISGLLYRRRRRK